MNLTDNQINAIISELDAYARDYNAYEYGLPTECEENVEEMRMLIRAALKEQR